MLPCLGLREVTAAKRKAKNEESKSVQLQVEQQLHLMKQQKMELKQQGIRSGFRSAEIEVADLAIANFFYAHGIPFSVAGAGEANSHYKTMVNAIRNTPASYVPPNRFRLSGPLLDQCYDKMTEAVTPDELLRAKYGIAYTQDGWDSCDHLPLINSAYITANNGGVFLRSVDTSGHTKSSEYIACLMVEDIYKIGCTDMSSWSSQTPAPK